MKNKLLACVVVALLSSSMVFGQEKGDARIIAGLGMGTKAAIKENKADKAFGTGISITGDYFIIDRLAVGTRYTFFFDSKIGDPATGEVTYSANTLNIECKYFFVTGGVNVYALAGVAFAAEKSVLSSALTEPLTFKDNFFGAVFGGGADFALGKKLFLNAQIAYNTPLEQLIMQAGVGFKF